MTTETRHRMRPVMRADKQNVPDTWNVLRFRDRTWSETTLKLPPCTDIQGALDEGGWGFSQRFGATSGYGLELFELRSDRRISTKLPSWVAVVLTADSFHLVILERIQDLIDFLSHVGVRL